MKNKELIWIDDNPTTIKAVIPSVIKKLWNLELRSKIYIWACDKKSSSFESQIENLNVTILNEFSNFLVEANKIEDEFVDHLYPLINDPGNICHDPEPFSNIAEMINPNVDEVLKAIDLLTLKNTDDLPKKIRNVQELVDKMALNFNVDKDKHIIILDMCLSKQDEKTLLDSNVEFNGKKYVKPIISMFLYKYYKDNGFNIYMYTSFISPNDMVENWKKCYKLLFDIQEPESVKIDFYKRNGGSMSGSQKLDEQIKAVIGE